MNIETLRLKTNRLSAQRAFYADTLGLPLEGEDGASFTVRVGSSRLTFQHDPAFDGFYHFAFAIPANQVREARAWLSARVPLLTDERGEDVFPSDLFASDNLYFDDADGNVVEFIARRELPGASDAPFGPERLLHVSEMGLVVADVPASVQDLRERHGLSPYRAESATFTAVGDITGMFIVVPEGRGWFPIGRPARPAPFTLTASTAAGPLVHEHVPTLDTVSGEVE